MCTIGRFEHVPVESVGRLVPADCPLFLLPVAVAPAQQQNGSSSSSSKKSASSSSSKRKHHHHHNSSKSTTIAAAAGGGGGGGDSDATTTTTTTTHESKKGKEKLVAVVVGDSSEELTSARAAIAQADSEEERRALAARVFTQFRRYSAGGLQMFDEEELKRQRGVVWELVKMVGNRIAEGMELRDIGIPIQLLQPSSTLECMTRAWAYAPTYLSAAARSTDPIERFKLVITFAIGGMHLSAQCKKPFNPILGETFQAAYCDGTEVYMEQTTHHPPASNWQVIGAHNAYQYWGRGVGSASARGNVIRGFQHGPNVLDFANGQRVTWNLPILTVHGVAWGDRVQHFDGVLQFRDDANQLACDVHMNAEALGFVKSLFSKPKQPTDFLRGDIMVGPPNKQSKVAAVEGSWLSHLDIGGTRYWDFERDLPNVLRAKSPKETLESDSFKREDLLAFAERDMERCAECKQMLEDRQRYDRRLREQARSARK